LGLRHEKDAPEEKDALAEIYTGACDKCPKFRPDAPWSEISGELEISCQNVVGLVPAQVDISSHEECHLWPVVRIG